MPETTTEATVEITTEPISVLRCKVRPIGVLAIEAANYKNGDGLSFDALHEGVSEIPDTAEPLKLDVFCNTIAAAAISGWRGAQQLTAQRQRQHIEAIGGDLLVKLRSFELLDPDEVEPRGILDAIENSVSWAVNKGRFSPNPRKWRGQEDTYTITVAAVEAEA